MGPEEDRLVERKTRLVAIVIAVTMLLWIGAQFIGKKYGLAGRYAILFDLAALAGFFWALVVTYQIWRARRDN